MKGELTKLCEHESCHVIATNNALVPIVNEFMQLEYSTFRDISLGVIKEGTPLSFTSGISQKDTASVMTSCQ
jgi:hypothetical protein